MRTMLTMPNVVYIIISNIPPTVYIRYTTFWNSSKLLFVLHILAFTKFQLRWYAPFQLLWTLFKSSFLPLRSLWKSDLKVIKPFEIAVFSGTFWIIWNFYSSDAPHANHGERCSSHLFWYCANWVNQIYSLLNLFEIGVCFCTFLLLWNFCSGDAHHANYGKHTLNPHFQHSANCVYQIYSVLNLFEIAVRFAHLAFTKFLLRWCAPWKIQWTLFKSSFPILPKLCKSDLQHFKALRNCSLFLHIFTFMKFLLRWCAPC